MKQARRSVDIRVRIELLYWEGCPSHPEALALLEDVLAVNGVEATVELHEIKDPPGGRRGALPGLADDQGRRS
jgi:hypothetical protein